MKFMILLYGNQPAWDALQQRDKEELAAAHAAIQAELTQNGELIGSAELSEVGAKVLSLQTGKVAVSNQPFTEGKQILSGYYMVNCANLERATQIAGQFAELKFAPIEVRAIEFTSSWTD